MNIPFWNRLSTRLGVLILVIVLVLAAATAILLSRGFSLAQQTLLELLSELGIQSSSDTVAIIRGTIINLIAVFLLTLVGATIFSRNLLTEPISSLVEATRKIAEGNYNVSLPITSDNELGLLADNFNQMSASLRSRTEELIRANEALRQNEVLLEQRVQERTTELMALLELSNSIALTVEDMPLIEHILDELRDISGYQAAILFEVLGQTFNQLMTRGHTGLLDDSCLSLALARKELVIQQLPDTQHYSFPISVRDKSVGVLLLEFDKEQQLGEEKLRLIATFANQIGVALENTKLYADVQEKAAFDERQHLARELHDSVSQALYSIVLGTYAARKQLERDPQQAAKALEYVQNLAEAGLAEMRALIFELRPEVLEKEGLSAAIRKQVEALEVRHGITAEFETDAEPDMPFAAKQALFRIVQEALHNIVKHAQTQHVQVTLRQQQALELTIQDKGIGFDTTQEFSDSLGLKSMRERALALGGSFHIYSSLGEGTTLLVKLPSYRSTQ